MDDVAHTTAAVDQSIKLDKKLKWHEHSFIYVLCSFLILPESALLWMVLLFFGMINLKNDPWHKTKFLIFLVAMVAFISFLRILFLFAVSR